MASNYTLYSKLAKTDTFGNRSTTERCSRLVERQGKDCRDSLLRRGSRWYPNKNNNNRKIESASSLSPSHRPIIPSCAFLFSSPRPPYDTKSRLLRRELQGTTLGRGGSRGRVQEVRTPPEMTCGFLIQLVFCKKKKQLCGLLVLK